jgi:hypothetical protein
MAKVAAMIATLINKRMIDPVAAGLIGKQTLLVGISSIRRSSFGQAVSLEAHHLRDAKARMLLM